MNKEPRIWCVSSVSVPVNPDGSPAYSIVKPMVRVEPDPMINEIAAKLTRLPAEDRCLDLVNIDEHDPLAWQAEHGLKMLYGANLHPGMDYWLGFFDALYQAGVERVAALSIDYERRGDLGYYSFKDKHGEDSAVGYAKLLSQVGILPDGHSFRELQRFDVASVRNAWVQQVANHVAAWIKGTIVHAAKQVWIDSPPEILIYESQPGGFKDRNGHACPVHTGGATYCPRLYLDPSDGAREPKSAEYAFALEAAAARGARMLPYLSPGFRGDKFAPTWNRVFEFPDEHDAKLCAAVAKNCAGAVIWNSYHYQASKSGGELTDLAIQHQRAAASMIADAFAGVKR